MIEELINRVNSSERLVFRGRFVSTTFLLEIGDNAWLVQIAEGRVINVTPGPFLMPRWVFALRAPADAWAKFHAKQPPPGFHDIFALVKKRLLRIEGDMHPFMANLFYFKGVLECLRGIC